MYHNPHFPHVNPVVRNTLQIFCSPPTVPTSNNVDVFFYTALSILHQTSPHRIYPRMWNVKSTNDFYYIFHGIFIPKVLVSMFEKNDWKNCFSVIFRCTDFHRNFGCSKVARSMCRVQYRDVCILFKSVTKLKYTNKWA